MSAGRNDRSTAIDPAAKMRLLTPRHRECLRLAYNRKVTKEIAAELGLAVGTVKTYCTEAIRILDARDRRDAAEQLHAWEAEHDLAPADRAPGGTPSRGEPPSGGVVSPLPLPPIPEATAPDWMRVLPFRYKDAPGNDLSVVARLFWIVALAFIIAVGFSVIASSLRLVSDLARGHGAG